MVENGDPDYLSNCGIKISANRDSAVLICASETTALTLTLSL